MKIYSGNSYATLTLTTGGGLVASVGHFYRGEPLYIEGGIKVTKVEVSTSYDYFIGFCNYKKTSKVGLANLQEGSRVIIRTDKKDYEVMVTEVMSIGKFPRYKFEPRIARHGDSGAPVLYDDTIIGYVTHENVFNSIAPITSAILKISKKASKANWG